jgi:hypothetical protein
VPEHNTQVAPLDAGGEHPLNLLGELLRRGSKKKVINVDYDETCLIALFVDIEASFRIELMKAQF